MANNGIKYFFHSIPYPLPRETAKHQATKKPRRALLSSTVISNSKKYYFSLLTKVCIYFNSHKLFQVTTTKLKNHY